MLLSVPATTIARIAFAVSTTTGGLAVGGFGYWQIRQADTQKQKHHQRLVARSVQHQERVEHLNDATQALDDTRARAYRDVVTRADEFAHRHGEPCLAAGQTAHTGIISTASVIDTVAEAWLDPKIAAWTTGLAGSVTTGRTTYTLMAQHMIRTGTSSTGTRIAELTGSSRTSALKAALAGGSKQAGGLGQAWGHVIHVGTATGVAVLTVGAGVKAAGWIAQTEADTLRHQTDAAILELDECDRINRTRRMHAIELDRALTTLIPPAVTALDLLESEQFDPEFHRTRMQTVRFFTAGIATIAAADASTTAGRDHTGEAHTARRDQHQQLAVALEQALNVPDAKALEATVAAIVGLVCPSSDHNAPAA